MTAARFLILVEKMNLFRSYLKKQKKKKPKEKKKNNKWKILWSIWKWKKWNLLPAFMALVRELRPFRCLKRLRGRHIWGFCSDQLKIESHSLKKPDMKFPWVETFTASENPSTSPGLLVTSRAWQVYRHGIQHDKSRLFSSHTLVFEARFTDFTFCKVP